MAHGEVEPCLLVVVEVMVGFASGTLGEERFVFQHAIEQSSRWIHAGSAFAEKGLREDAEGLRIALKAAVGLHEAVQRALASVAEGRMAEIVAEAGAFDEIGVDEALVIEHTALLAEPTADAAADLSDLNAVGEPGAVEVVFAGEEDLRLALQTAEGAAVDDAVAVDLECAAVFAVEDFPLVERGGVEGVVEAVGGHFEAQASAGSGAAET